MLAEVELCLACATMELSSLLADQPDLLQRVDQMGFTHATPVQQQAIPYLLEHHDVLMQAPTGSGKTLAFALRAGQIASLIILPTRELAQQVYQVTEALGLDAQLIHGGVAREPQLALLQQSISLLIATPGRLIDLLRDEPTALAHIKLLVLDEGDHLLKDGFAQQIDDVMRALPQLTQQVCCSATLAPALVAVAQSVLHQPEAVIIDRDSVPSEVDQQVLRVHGGNKQFLLQKLLRKNKSWQKVMVFTRSKMGADRIARALKQVKIRSASVHGDCRQNQRQRTMEQFEDGEIRVLVATDLAGRGLDFSQVDVVINFNYQMMLANTYIESVEQVVLVLPVRH